MIVFLNSMATDGSAIHTSAFSYAKHFCSLYIVFGCCYLECIICLCCATFGHQTQSIRRNMDIHMAFYIIKYTSPQENSFAVSTQCQFSKWTEFFFFISLKLFLIFFPSFCRKKKIIYMYMRFLVVTLNVQWLFGQCAKFSWNTQHKNIYIKLYFGILCTGLLFCMRTCSPNGMRTTKWWETKIGNRRSTAMSTTTENG